MIVKMKKIHLIVQEKNIDSTLSQLRDLGIVHIEHLETPRGQKLDGLKREIKKLNKVIALLSGYDTDLNEKQQERIVDWQQKLDEILSTREELDDLREYLRKNVSLIDYWEPWGDFNVNDISELTARGVYVWLCELSRKDLKKVPKEIVLKKISRSKGITRYVAISKEKIEFPFRAIRRPAYSLNEMKGFKKETEDKIAEKENMIKNSVVHLKGFENILKEKQEELTFQKMSSGMKRDELLSLLKGFSPVDKVESLESQAKKMGWGILVEEPSDDDKVPTLIRNPKWIETIKPMFDIMNISPGYYEFDISLWFLLFFSVFVGMIVGDAAYGTLILIATFYFNRKFKTRGDLKPIFALFYVMCTSTIIWGLLTGTFFRAGMAASARKASSSLVKRK